MQRKIFGIGAIALTLSLAACSSSRMVQGPPRLDLRQYGRVGMLDVTTQPGNTLGTEANRAFVAAIQTAQPGVPVLELGNESQVLRDVGAFLLTPETLRAIGKKHGVET
ncbi:MAG: hypothetical protein KC591_09275, partial [Gemmatimonadetes bacterium]|nr:hypothetical protein [Gemmatimonadota bacterium]